MSAWNFELDFPVDDFEQLIFIVNHGLDDLFAQVASFGFSTEHLDITFMLNNQTTQKLRDKNFVPDARKNILAKADKFPHRARSARSGDHVGQCEAHFTRPRPDQKGLYAVSRPEPESLLLTANKLKKLVGEENVGIPVLLNQRLPSHSRSTPINCLMSEAGAACASRAEKLRFPRNASSRLRRSIAFI